MNVLSLNYEDLAGLSYNLCTAINELTDHHATSVVLATTWIRYPAMVVGKAAIQAKMPGLVRDADVIHINESPGLVSSVGGKPEDCQDKQIIYHAHGSKFRRKFPSYLKLLYSSFPQAKVITSTPDLLSAVPEATWFPAIVPIEHYRKEYPVKRNDPPIIYGAQTRPKRHRPGMIKVLDQLREEGLKFEVQWVYGKQHRANLTLKAQADIYYDRLVSPMYGVNAIEAAGFEMPVVCTMTPIAKDQIDSLGIDCPYIDPYLQTADDQKDELRRLITDKSYRAQRGEAGYNYVQAVHSPEVCVKRFLEMVE